MHCKQATRNQFLVGAYTDQLALDLICASGGTHSIDFCGPTLYTTVDRPTLHGPGSSARAEPAEPAGSETAAGAGSETAGSETAEPAKTKCADLD